MPYSIPLQMLSCPRYDFTVERIWGQERFTCSKRDVTRVLGTKTQEPEVLPTDRAERVPKIGQAGAADALHRSEVETGRERARERTEYLFSMSPRCLLARDLKARGEVW